MEPDGLDDAIERSRLAVSEIIRGNPEPCEVLFSHEDGTWKLVHRHADPITTPRPSESVVPN